MLGLDVSIKLRVVGDAGYGTLACFLVFGMSHDLSWMKPLAAWEKLIYVTVICRVFFAMEALLPII